MSKYGEEWTNDASDLNNLNSAMGSKKKDKSQHEKERRFIDHFYPFGHTGRIEHLFVMESNSKEPLHANLVTAGERAEYAEYGVRYAIKEILVALSIFLLAVIMQAVSLLKYPSSETPILDQAPIFTAAVTMIYGLAYTFHLAKYNVGPLTGKVIAALLAGRMIVILSVVFGVGWGLSMMEDYIYANTSIILTIADYAVPDRSNGFYELIATAYSYLMMPFGGGFPVSEQGVAYMLTVIAPELFPSWREAGLISLITAVIPIVVTAIYRQINATRDQKVQVEYENY